MKVLLGFAWPISESVVERLGWVLVHSLWQFALAALLAGLAVRTLRRRSAATRYGVLVVALAVAVAAPVATWMLQPGNAPDHSVSAATRPGTGLSPLASSPTIAGDPGIAVPSPDRPASSAPSEMTPPTPTIIQPTPSWPEQAKTVLRPWLAWIVAGWGLGVVVCSLRPLLGWHVLRRLRRVGVSPAPGEVLAALKRVSEQLGLKRAVRVLQSTLVQVPVMVGYLRPVILLPVSLVTFMPVAHMEAILAHELAHVRRHDFAINLLQTLVETIFFYHPAVWWLSRQIRVEREHCCDDLVVLLLGNRVEYGRALVAIEQLRGQGTVFALGAADGSLLGRVRRIAGVGSERDTLSLHGRWPAALLGFALIGVTCGLAMNWSLAAKATPDDVGDFGPESNGLRCRLVAVPTTADDESPHITKPATEFARGDDVTFAVELQNVSDKPVTLLGVRYSDNTPAVKGKLNTAFLGPRLFQFEFTDANGKPVPRTARAFEEEFLSGASAHELSPRKSLIVLLRPAKFHAPMDHRFLPGKFRAKVRYRGPSDKTLAEIKKHWPDRPQGKAWSNEVSSNEVAFSVAADPTAPRPQKLVWGPAKDGLQAAIELRAPKRVAGIPTEAPGVPLKTNLGVVFHVKNVSDRPITFASETGRQGDHVHVKNEAGKEIMLRDTWFSGEPIMVRWKLKPGEIAELQVLAPAIYGTKQPGKYTVRYTIRFNSMQSKDSKGNITFPLKGDWQSELETGEIPLFLRARTPGDDARERQAALQNLRDEDVEKFALDTLRTPFQPDPVGGSWQGGAYEMDVLSSLSMVRQRDRVVKTLMKVVERTEKSTQDQRRLAMLYLAGAAPRQVIPILIKELEAATRAPAERFVPYHEIAVLQQIGEVARDAVPVLIKLLDSPDRLARSESLLALVKIGPSSTEVMNAIAKRFGDPGAHVWSRAVYEVGRYGEQAKPLGPTFVKLLESKSKPARIWAAQALVSSGYDEARGFDVLIRDVAAGAPEDRSQAATALAALGSRAKSMVPKLRAYENDPVERVAKEVRDAICRIEKDDRIFTHAEEAAKSAASRKAAAEAEIERHLPDWLRVHHNRGLLANLDDDRNVVSLTTGEVMSDELLGKLKTLPKLRELDIGTTKLITPAGLKHLAELSSLQKLSLSSLNHDGKGLGDTAIEHIVGLKSLRELHLNQCGTTDAGVRLLEAMPQLTHLELYAEAGLTDAALASIAKLKRLKHVGLNSYVGTEQGWMRFSKEATGSLAGLQELEHLHLVGQEVSPETLQFPRLKTLSLGSAVVDDACAARIAECRQLQTLDLVYTNITDAGLNKFADLPELSRLNLDSRVVTDAGIRHLKRLPKLQHISLRASQLTDESLRYLAEITTLTRVDLNGSGEPGVSAGTCYTIAGVQRLKALPNLRTLWLTNFDSAGGFHGLKELSQLRELTMMMTNIRVDELDALVDALPNTSIHHATGGGSYQRGPQKKRLKIADDKIAGDKINAKKFTGNAKPYDLTGRVVAISKDAKSITVEGVARERPAELVKIEVKIGEKTAITYDGVTTGGARPTEGYVVGVWLDETVKGLAARVGFGVAADAHWGSDLAGTVVAVDKDGKGITLEISDGGVAKRGVEKKKERFRFNDKTVLVFSDVAEGKAEIAVNQTAWVWYDDNARVSGNRIAGQVRFFGSAAPVRRNRAPDIRGKLLNASDKSLTIEQPAGAGGGEPKKVVLKIGEKCSFVYHNVGPGGARPVDCQYAGVWFEDGSKETAAEVALSGVVRERWLTISGKVVEVSEDGATITLEQPSAVRGEKPKRVEIKLTSQTRITYSNVGPDGAKPTAGYVAQVRLIDGSKDTAARATFEQPRRPGR